MYKLHASVHKEMLLLSRDKGGLAVLFLMPLVLIITISLLQSGSFETLQTDKKIPVLLVDNDRGALSAEMRGQMEAFDIITENAGTAYTETAAKEAVFAGEYQLAVVIPARMSRDLDKKVSRNVTEILSEFGLEGEESTAADTAAIAPKEIKLYFDPAVRASFKNAVKSNIEKLISQIETRSVYAAFQKELGAESDDFLSDNKFISFRELTPADDGAVLIPNATQHNVPAWTLFAMFFIVVPLSISMVKEKNQGTSVRLRTQPVSFATVLGGKVCTYLTVCLVQFGLMLLIGVYVLPWLDLPRLELNPASFVWLLFTAFFSGLAATGFGILVGTIARTQEQSASFGSTAVVILAAIGGVWIPVFLMPNFMQIISEISPMNWGLDAFQDILLRGGGLRDILPEAALLLLFFLLTLTVSIIYDAQKRAV